MNLRNIVFIFALVTGGLPLVAQEPAPAPAGTEAPATTSPDPDPAQAAPAPATPDPAQTASGSSAMEAPPLVTEPLFPDPLPDGTIPSTGTSDSPELIPDFQSSTAPTIPPGVRSSSSKTSKEAAELERRIKFRQAKTKAERDPEVVAHLQRAESAKTDPEKRQALREFYDARARRMLKIDGSIKAEIEENLKGHLGELEQNKVRSSDNPPERQD